MEGKGEGFEEVQMVRLLRMSRLHRQTHNREWERIRTQVFERDGHRCADCRRAGRLEAHHMLELHRGGTNDLGNLKTLCRSCHIAVHRRKEDPGWAGMVKELR